MNNITGLLIALGFVLIGIFFMVMYFVVRAKVIKKIGQVLDGKSSDSVKNSQYVIEGTKKLVWYLGIAYVTIALSLFFEGLSGAIDSTIVVVLFVIAGVLLFLYGVFMTAYGVLALYNDREQKYGKMEKATLVSVCKLEDGKNLLVFVPAGSFGGSTLNSADSLSANNLDSYRSAGGRMLDCCVVDDAKDFNVNAEYLLYVSMLRVKYSGVNVCFITDKGIEATISEAPKQKEVKKESKKAPQPKEEQKTKPVKKAEKTKKAK